jgi:hypothetical protein
MPKTKVWPTPLPVGTDVQIRSGPGKGKVGVISEVRQFRGSWAYSLQGDAFGKYMAHRVRPLDLSDPADVEVYLNG